jgi:Cft2 family RNA processing exonuclease
MKVNYHKGIELPGHELWLDPRGSRPLAFVSHAHSDHLGRHKEVIASAGTMRLMRERLGGGKRVLHTVSFRERFSLPHRPGLEMEILPAGHIFGSAQIYLESGTSSLLYTGDFKMRPGLSSEALEWRNAETLVMETTFGKPYYRMPPTEEVIAQIVAFCRGTLEEGGVPVLLAYSLGKAQEAICALLAAGLTPMLHHTVFKMTEIYREMKEGFPGGYLPFGAEGGLEGRVFICPPPVARTSLVRKIAKHRVAVLTGWAVDPRTKYRYGVDAAFALSDHADYDELLRYVELVQPKRVLTLHGFAAAFACDLRARGVEAWAISEENQLEFAL